jgi:hypothetical protein
MQDHIIIMMVIGMAMNLPVGTQQMKFYASCPGGIVDPDLCIQKIGALIGIETTGMGYLQ